MKKIIIILSFFVLFISAKTQPPAGYYDAANGLTGAQLKTALYNIIKNHTQRTYAELWTDFQTTDRTTAGKVWDMYSNCVFTFGADQCGSYVSECDCYNREHSFPRSWFGGDVSPMWTDLFHLVPTDGKVNGMRNNHPFGEVSAPTYTSGNGGKLGPCSYPGYTGTVFEPINEYKGDFARNYFYMATRYENVIASWENDDPEGDAILNGTSFPAFETWTVNLLLKWNTQDPVSTKETARNNAVYGIQHNRNPFIDHPEWAAAIWGNGGAINDNYADIFGNVQIYPNPSNNFITIDKINDVVSLSVADIVGKIIYTKNNPASSAEIDLKNYSKGFYFLTLYGKENQSRTFKFIKD